LRFEAIAAKIGLAGVLHYTTIPLSSMANEDGSNGLVDVEQII